MLCSHVSKLLPVLYKRCVLPDASLVDPHAKTDSGHNDWHLSFHPLSLDLTPLFPLQTWGGRGREGAGEGKATEDCSLNLTYPLYHLQCDVGVPML